MSILRLILLFVFGLLVRRVYLAFKSATSGSRPDPNHGKPSGNSDPGKPQAMDDLTEQDISDADFEEIP
jgi:hypothetical protein